MRQRDLPRRPECSRSQRWPATEALRAGFFECLLHVETLACKAGSESENDASDDRDRRREGQDVLYSRPNLRRRAESRPGLMARIAATPQPRDRKKPSPPPSAASNTLSVSNCRTMRQRLAPIAMRTAISFCRVGRAGQQQGWRRSRRRSASTKPTAPNKTHRASEPDVRSQWNRFRSGLI